MEILVYLALISIPALMGASFVLSKDIGWKNISTVGVFVTLVGL